MLAAIAPDLETRQGPQADRKKIETKEYKLKSWRTKKATMHQWRKETTSQSANPRTVWEAAVVRVDTLNDDGERVQYILPDTQDGMDTHTLSRYIQRRLESITPHTGGWKPFDENLSEKLEAEDYYFVSKREISIAWVFEN